MGFFGGAEAHKEVTAGIAGPGQAFVGKKDFDRAGMGQGAAERGQGWRIGSW
jgi:hypothetical protein